MHNVDFHCSNFSSIPTGKHIIQIDWVDLVWAAISYGKRNASQLIAYQWHSLAELVVKTHSVYAFLRSGPTGFEKSDLYSNLDATEKGAASYFLGMTMCKIFADQKLNTPWLFHVSLATSNGASILFNKVSKERPDLIGLTMGNDWIVAEAKGRSKQFSTKALQKAKKQSTMVLSVNGISPIHRFGIQSCFDPQLMAHVEDPPIAREAYPIELDLREALAHYYSISSALSRYGEEKQISGIEYLVVNDPRSGLSVGLPKHIVKEITSPEVSQQGVTLKTHRISEQEKIYSDGFYVRLDDRWAQKNMRQQPRQRGDG
ncbi:MAG TPA: hypothetical protein VLC71_09590 [Thermomonas sp.]|nr:hypothetical protein [Thermomonas sp.]